MNNFKENDDPMGLKSLDEKLKSIGKSWEKPKPVNTKDFQKNPRYMDGEEYRNKKRSSIQDMKNGMELAKKGISETKKTIKGLSEMIKNRKIHKLENEALKTKTQADQLAHEIKTKTALIDSMNDVKRYQQEKEKIDQELEQARKESKHD